MDSSFITIALKRLGDQVVDRLQQQLDTDDTVASGNLSRSIKSQAVGNALTVPMAG